MANEKVTNGKEQQAKAVQQKEKQTKAAPVHHELTETEHLLVQVVDFIEQYVGEEMAELGDRMEKIGKMLFQKIAALEASAKKSGTAKVAKKPASKNGGARRPAPKKAAVKVAKKPAGKASKKVARRR